jgi:hypothetical protein
MEIEKAHPVRLSWALAGAPLVLVLLLTMAAVTSAQTVILPPIITETIEPPEFGPGDHVVVTLRVDNPNPPGQPHPNEGIWYNLHITYELDPMLQIDNVDVTPPADVLTVDGNTVLVTINVLAPGATFVITIDCTALGESAPGHLVRNEATLEYTDAEGNPQPPITKVSVYRIMVPLVVRNYAGLPSPDCQELITNGGFE